MSLRRSGLNRDGRVYIKHLDGWLGWRKSRLDHLGWPMFGLFSSMAGKISQVKVLWQRFPFVPSGQTSLGLDLRTTSLLRNFLLLVFLHSCHPSKKRCKWKSKLNQQKSMMYDVYLSSYLRLRIVTSCAMASSDGSGPSPHLARRLRVTKEWKSLSTCRRARWMLPR